MSINDEGRDMWKVYLDMKEYAAALANCRDPFQRDQVYLVQVPGHLHLLCLRYDLSGSINSWFFFFPFYQKFIVWFFIRIFVVQAEAAFSSKDYFRAASFYAKVNSLFKFTILVYYI